MIDLDEICRSLGSHGHDHPWHVKRMAERIRDALEAQAGDRPGRTFVVRSLPNPSDRQAVADRLGADVVVLAIPPDEAVARAHADARPAWTEQAIHDWWSRYRPSATDTELTAGDAGESA